MQISANRQPVIAFSSTDNSDLDGTLSRFTSKPPQLYLRFTLKEGASLLGAYVSDD